MTAYFLLSLTLLSLLLTSCEEAGNTGDAGNTTYVTLIQKMGSDGLDLQAVTDLATKVESPQQFEQKLNAPGNQINNLDLNEDDEVDFIKITEINDTSGKGFSLTTEVAPNEEQELAVIQFEVDENTQQGTVQTHGNSQIYGHHHYYHNSFGVTDLLLWSYFLRPHTSYSSGWGYRRYPDYHRTSRPVSSSQYKKFHKDQSYTKTVSPSTRSVTKTPIKSPNYNKTAQSIKAPLRNPSTSQRAFQARNPSKSQPRAKGFSGTNSAKPSSSASKPSNSARIGSSGSSSSSRSRSSFGGGK